MTVWILNGRCLLLFLATTLTSSRAANTSGGHVDLDLDLRELDACVAGSAGCDALSLRQLRGEPVHAAAQDVTQSGEGKGQSEAAEKGAEAIVASAGWGWNTWTIVADTSESGWAWDVLRVKFLTLAGEELSPSTPGCHVVESGHVDVPGYSPQNAFSDDESWWGGRKDSATGKFYLGIACSSDRKVAAVQLKQGSGSHSVSQVQVFHNHLLLKTKRVSSGWLQNVWAGSFGLRLAAKSMSSGWAWDVRRLKVLLPPDGGELQPNGASPFYCHAVESGHVDTPGYQVSNAFEDHGAWWGGRRDAANNFFIGIECDRPFEWPQSHDIYLDQLSGHYASEVQVQELTAFGWKTKDTLHVGPGELMPLA